MDDKLVTVATFSEPIQAHLASAKLAAEGIEYFIIDENIVSMYWLYSQAVGGVKLQVRENDAEKALQTLRISSQKQDAVAGKIEPEKQGSDSCCPKCGSGDIQYEKYSKKTFFLTILFLGFPVSYLKDECRCNSCGHRWQ
jgi:hypothetical protein